MKGRKIMNFKHPVVGILICAKFGNSIEEDRFGSNSCFLRGFQPVVFLGRCFGALARTDILDKINARHSRKLNPATLMTSIITLFLIINAILLYRHNFQKFQYDKTTLVKLEGFNHAGYAASMSITYLYQLFGSGRLRNIVKSFLLANQASHLPSFTQRCGISKYPSFSWIILITCLVFGILENAVFDWQSLQRGAGRNETLSVAELYYTENFKHWHVMIPKYNAPLIIILAVLIKLATWGWIYMDVVCVLLCRAIWEKLWIISHNLRWSPFWQLESGVGVSSKNPEITSSPTQKNIDIYKEEYVMITHLVEQVQRYISPLIVVCYIGNMYIIIVMLFNWIGPFSTEMVSSQKTIHVCLAFFQFLFRVVIITYFAGEIHQMSLEIRRRIQMCPNSMYTPSLERLEHILIANPTGICLFGSFMITRKFFVSIVSFIFTTEIVLLQSYNGYYSAYNSNTTDALVKSV